MCSISKFACVGAASEIAKKAVQASAAASETEKSKISVPVSMLPPKELANKYGLSYTLVLLLAKMGKIAAIRTGVGKNGRLLINENSLCRYLDSAYLTDEPPDETSTVKGIRHVGSEVWKRG